MGIHSASFVAVGVCSASLVAVGIHSAFLAAVGVCSAPSLPWYSQCPRAAVGIHNARLVSVYIRGPSLLIKPLSRDQMNRVAWSTE